MDKDLWLSKIWDEWLISPVKSREYADAETCGLLMGMRRRNTFTTNRLKAARRLTGPGKYPLWPLTSYSRKTALNVSMITRPNRKASVKITLTPGVRLQPPQNSALMWLWLKGLWGSTGGLYFPKTGYYLTLIISDAELSQITRGILAKTGLTWSIHRNEFTLRNHDDITTFLYNAGMESGALDFEGKSLIRSARNRANIARNYDTANIARSVKAARQQYILAEKAVSSEKFDALPETLREAVRVRLANPEISLEELGGMLNPPVAKSTVNYRWNKIRKFIEA